MVHLHWHVHGYAFGHEQHAHQQSRRQVSALQHRVLPTFTLHIRRRSHFSGENMQVLTDRQDETAKNKALPLILSLSKCGGEFSGRRMGQSARRRCVGVLQSMRRRP